MHFLTGSKGPAAACLAKTLFISLNNDNGNDEGNKKMLVSTSTADASILPSYRLNGPYNKQVLLGYLTFSK